MNEFVAAFKCMTQCQLQLVLRWDTEKCGIKSLIFSCTSFAIYCQLAPCPWAGRFTLHCIQGAPCMQPQLVSSWTVVCSFCCGFIMIAERLFDGGTQLLSAHISIMLPVFASQPESNSGWICPIGNIYYPNNIECCPLSSSTNWKLRIRLVGLGCAKCTDFQTSSSHVHSHHQMDEPLFTSPLNFQSLFPFPQHVALYSVCFIRSEAVFNQRLAVSGQLP